MEWQEELRKRLTDATFVAIDVSGTMPAAIKEEFMSIVKEKVRDRNFIYWDTDVRLSPVLSGMGGTDPQPLFDWMISNGHGKDELVVFTDGLFKYNYSTNGVKTTWFVTFKESSPPGGEVIFVQL
jgi:predicted metal-dependent peptidase